MIDHYYMQTKAHPLSSKKHTFPFECKLSDLCIQTRMVLLINISSKNWCKSFTKSENTAGAFTVFDLKSMSFDVVSTPPLKHIQAAVLTEDYIYTIIADPLASYNESNRLAKFTLPENDLETCQLKSDLPETSQEPNETSFLGLLMEFFGFHTRINSNEEEDNSKLSYKFDKCLNTGIELDDSIRHPVIHLPSGKRQFILFDMFQDKPPLKCGIVDVEMVEINSVENGSYIASWFSEQALMKVIPKGTSLSAGARVCIIDKNCNVIKTIFHKICDQGYSTPQLSPDCTKIVSLLSGYETGITVCLYNIKQECCEKVITTDWNQDLHEEIQWTSDSKNLVLALSDDQNTEFFLINIEKRECFDFKLTGIISPFKSFLITHEDILVYQESDNSIALVDLKPLLSAQSA